MGPNIWSVVIIAALILILFGRGRISEMMGDIGKGISSFKRGVKDTEEAASSAKAQIEAPAQEASQADAKPSEKNDSAN